MLESTKLEEVLREALAVDDSRGSYERAEYLWERGILDIEDIIYNKATGEYGIGVNPALSRVLENDMGKFAEFIHNNEDIPGVVTDKKTAAEWFGSIIKPGADYIFIKGTGYDVDLPPSEGRQDYQKARMSSNEKGEYKVTRFIYALFFDAVDNEAYKSRISDGEKCIVSSDEIHFEEGLEED